MYVSRDTEGRIISLHQEATAEAQEAISPRDPEVMAFIGQGSELDHSDSSLIRVIEDLVDVLIQKNVLRLTDLPNAAQAKLLSRKSLRQRLSHSLDLLNDNDKGLL
ncbi:hypothetical protein [Chitinibacter tainanensis]|uniref:hypothetical protein n=1 Tax=Chitinibacter tainanensis TaxID=230667 RepID=UPI0004230121|nr:hypothetical protein [Chitinibacter tainanensis]